MVKLGNYGHALVRSDRFRVSFYMVKLGNYGHVLVRSDRFRVSCCMVKLQNVIAHYVDQAVPK